MTYQQHSLSISFDDFVSMSRESAQTHGHLLGHKGDIVSLKCNKASS